MARGPTKAVHRANWRMVVRFITAVAVCDWICLTFHGPGVAADDEGEQTATGNIVEDSHYAPDELDESTLGASVTGPESDMSDIDRAVAELLKGSHTFDTDNNAPRELFGDRSTKEAPDVPVVHMVRASSGALRLRGLKVPTDGEGHLIEGVAMGGHVAEGDAFIGLPDVFSLGRPSVLKGFRKMLGGDGLPVAGNPMPLFNKGKHENFTFRGPDGELKCKEGARYREGRLLAIQQVQNKGEFEAGISFSPIVPSPLDSKPRGILDWIRGRVSRARAAVDLPEGYDYVGPLPLRFDIPTTERDKVQEDVEELHGAPGFLLCLVTGQKPLLIHAPQIAQLPVFKGGSWRSQVKVRDVRVFADPLDSQFFLLQCVITQQSNSLVFVVPKTDESQSPKEQSKQPKAALGEKPGGSPFPKETGAEQDESMEIEMEQPVPLSTHGTSGPFKTISKHESFNPDPHGTSSLYAGPRRTEERQGPFAWTGVGATSKYGQAHGIGGQWGPQEQPSFYFEVITRTNKFPVALLLAATLEGASCFLERNGINNTLALRCGAVHGLELKYRRDSYMKKHITAPRYHRTVLNSLLPVILGTASHAAASYANNKLWSTPEGAEFQESLYLHNNRAGRGQALHLLHPGNLALAVHHPEKEMKVFGSIQSLGMLAAVGFLTTGLATLVSAFLQMSDRFEKESKLSKSLDKLVGVAERQMEALKPEFTKGKSLTIFCVDGQKP